ncbi:MAG: M15 family metallopeptidase [bacterium]
MQKYGHLQYQQIDKKKLIVVGEYDDGRKKYLAKEASVAFKIMRKEAQKDDVHLVIISGFRTKKYQKWLFGRAVKKYGSQQEAAKHVAPPGNSEHHTGSAVDIGDEQYPKTDLQISFETTPAFIWMQQHAEEYGFILSFPKDNPAGVSYEPWHWRYMKKD